VVRGLGSEDGTTTLTAKIASSAAAIGQQYKRTSPVCPGDPTVKGSP
jgi:hypothetical protein